MTPLMQQYRRIKSRYPDAILFFRLGDFYEMFYEDARLASRLLGLTLTSREKGPDAVPMCGVPYHSAETYIKRLIQEGHRVAICEQLQDPAKATGLVERDVVRVVTAGTLTEDSLLEERRNNFLLSVACEGERIGLAWVDVSTGQFFVQETARRDFPDALVRISAAECLLSDHLAEDDSFLRNLRAIFEGMITRRPDWTFDRSTAREELHRFFGVTSLDGFGVNEQGLAVCAAGALVNYLNETQRVSLSHITKLTPFVSSGRLIMDRSTMRSLELVETMRTRQREGTLLWVLDRTITPMGARLLRSWLEVPLAEVGPIRERLEAVRELASVENSNFRIRLSELFRQISDIERIAAKVACQRATPRDLLGLSRSLFLLPKVKEALSHVSSRLLAEIRDRMDLLEDVARLIQSSISADAPASLQDGGVIREGFSAELDELRSLAHNAKSWIAGLQQKEISRTGIPSLKVGFNQVFGYYIEVTHTHSKKVPSDYIRKQTLKNAERYITPELKSYEAKVLSAEERSRALEYELFVKVRSEVGESVERIQESGSRIAKLDLLLSLATVAVENDYVEPEIDDGMVIELRASRHPVLERTLTTEAFVPNDVYMDGDQNRLLVITGPNMAGKSTYIRQVALIVIMAQMGSFVPARKARIGIVDRLFTRIGASDELARGASTFMVEMNEAANILNNASPRSLIILDEVGRGTSTFDGVSIAWAASEYIQKHLKARTLFATHYHEMTQLAEVLPGVKNYNIAVKEWADEIIFLRKIVEGGTDKSYGIQVARLAGVPKEVIERAKVILSELEEEALHITDLARGEKPKGTPRAKQLPLFRFEPHPVIEELKKLDPEHMTPIEALKALSELKKKLKEKP